ncbi:MULTISPECIES: UDP-glucose 4-epimerase GalE [Bacillales]|jgi:UDP-glucose 4-epimerase|uniref:UDP-glucose 4-epimerase GalE n=1 Tax=Brevibacillus TaxID=55080 RepID=UPI0014929A8B|nr:MULTISPECIES: UDP-glucose 4-epimerase GalE [Bacillales]MBR8658736.1 UDP-glucose 4-epimerase GalE [Brevibacillus sp. NL20B1]NNV03020.1 UDP-glucose 4-epimerase GalE [Brevibacillus sp. MCWH]UFJ61601.1 UDP-glucose 4-epimerase GalE [Anoxybacillus sediminis]
MAILVTGGTGYIGSHTVAELLAHGEEVVVVDNLRTGHERAVLGGTLYRGDIRDRRFLDEVFRAHEIEAVIHFAAKSLVGESVRDPLGYYDNNVIGTHTLVSAMLEHGVRKVVFSSTAAVYGEPERIPIREEDPTVPTNPYGETKLAMEKMFRWCDQAYGLKSISLRYFNAAGAHPDALIGEDHEPESHLIPLVLQVALGRREQIEMFGDDYPTEDGTCIRDYVHVMDLANAHRLALNYLRTHNRSDVFNLGNGTGFSVKQVIDTARKVTGHPIPAKVSPRRAGDPAVLVASADKAKRLLNWQPRCPELETIIASAWNWHRRHPHGYASVDR